MTIILALVLSPAWGQEAQRPPAAPQPPVDSRHATVTIGADGTVAAAVPCRQFLGLGTKCVEATGRLIVNAAAARSMDRDNAVSVSNVGDAQSVTSGLVYGYGAYGSAWGQYVYTPAGPTQQGQYMTDLAASGGGVYGTMPVAGDREEFDAVWRTLDRHSVAIYGPQGP